MAIAPTERPSGFWSYVHRDDSASRGRVLKLAQDLREEFETMTGEQLELFVDRTHLDWGAKWRSTLNDAITESTFFIAIVTPHFFKSDECRNEFLQFVQNARKRDVVELVLPILWVHDDGIKEDSTDEVKKAVAEIQWEDCTDLRLADTDGVDWIRKVNYLATKLIGVVNDIAARVETTQPVAPPSLRDPDEGGATSDGGSFVDTDETDGLLDLNAKLETLFPEWLPTLERYQELMDEFTQITNEYTPLMEAAGNKSQAARLTVARNYARALMPVAQEFQQIGTVYADQAIAAHGNVVGILQYLLELSPEDRAKADAGEFLESVAQLAQAGKDAVGSIEGFRESYRVVSKMSKDVRRPLALIDQGVRSFMDGYRLFEDWLERIDELQRDIPPRLTAGQHVIDDDNASSAGAGSDKNDTEGDH